MTVILAIRVIAVVVRICRLRAISLGSPREPAAALRSPDD